MLNCQRGSTPVVQAADQTVRQAGKPAQEADKGPKRSVSWRFSAAKLSIFRGTLRACQDGGVFRQPMCISWNPGPSVLAMESDPGQVSRGLYISGLPIAVIRKQTIERTMTASQILFGASEDELDGG